MKKVKCGNPNCGKYFLPEGSGKNQRKYCCASCKDVARFLRSGQIASKDDFLGLRSGTIILPNKIEIRNDCMGKELAERCRYSYYSR